MATIQTSSQGLLIFSGLLLFAGCLFQKPCSDSVLVEIPVTTEYKDTMYVGDTIHYRVEIPDEVTDLESGVKFSLPDDLPLGIELLLEDIDKQNISDQSFAEFDILPIQGNIDINRLSSIGLEVGKLEFERDSGGRAVELNIIPRYSGRYGFGLFSVYAIFSLHDERFFTKELELFGSDDCSEELNLVFSRDGGSERGYTEYTGINDTTARVSLDFYQQSGKFFITVVE